MWVNTLKNPLFRLQMNEELYLSDQADNTLRDERFLRLLMTNQNRIYAFILALVHNCADADDIMQETTTLIWRKFDEFEPHTDFIAWALTIARYKTLQYLDKYRDDRVLFSARLLEMIQEQMPKKLEGTGERKKALKKCLAKLGEYDQRLVVMRYQNKLTIKKVAALIGVSVHIMYRTMARIHKSLRICIRGTLAEGGMV